MGWDFFCQAFSIIRNMLNTLMKSNTYNATAIAICRQGMARTSHHPEYRPEPKLNLCGNHEPRMRQKPQVVVLMLAYIQVLYSALCQNIIEDSSSSSSLRRLLPDLGQCFRPSQSTTMVPVQVGTLLSPLQAITVCNHILWPRTCANILDLQVLLGT